MGSNMLQNHANMYPAGSAPSPTMVNDPPVPASDYESQMFQANQVDAKPGPYFTKLPPGLEGQYQQWAKHNDRKPSEAGYDMRGRWLAFHSGDPRAAGGFNATAGEMHDPDVWKTPYSDSFSNESIYAKPTAPKWQGQFLVNSTGKAVYDDKTGKRIDDSASDTP